jgi:thioredoxin reductase (NADPH)
MATFQPLNISNNPSSAASGDVEKVKCLIIGSGPAGYTAAIYAARANLGPVLYEGLQPGGQLTTTTEIDNFPGYPEGIAGPIMMEDLKKQAIRFNTEVRFGLATAVDFSKRPFKVTIDENKIIEAQVVIIATGATAKYLGLPSEEKFKGSGVSACATCDGFFYKGQDVAVVGGGDTACEEATYLAGLCKKVYVIVRKNYLRASKVMQERVINTPNIQVLFEHTTKELTGNDGVDGVILLNKKGEEVKIDVTGFFVAIGHEPNSGIFKPYLETDDTGYIKTTPGTSKTSVPGVFACGDVQDKNYRQAITAAGSGCMAAIDAERFLVEHGLA